MKYKLLGTIKYVLRNTLCCNLPFVSPDWEMIFEDEWFELCIDTHEFWNLWYRIVHDTVKLFFVGTVFRIVLTWSCYSKLNQKSRKYVTFDVDEKCQSWGERTSHSKVQSCADRTQSCHLVMENLSGMS